MKGKELKKFIISNSLIVAIFIFIISSSTYLMKNVTKWEYIIVLLLIALAYVVVSALNIVHHVRK
jgi:hypothetical protein